MRSSRSRVAPVVVRATRTVTPGTASQGHWARSVWKRPSISPYHVPVVSLSDRIGVFASSIEPERITPRTHGHGGFFEQHADLYGGAIEPVHDARACTERWAVARRNRLPAGIAARSVVLIVVDTLRADHLGVYGYDRPTSPNLDAWAEDGAVFEHAFSTSPWTLPSFGTMFTGHLPSRHLAGTFVRGADGRRPTGASSGNSTRRSPRWRKRRPPLDSPPPP